MIPSGVQVSITRNYGESANDKVNELVRELGLAIIIVVGLIAFALGWREAVIVVTAVPLTFALTLLVNYLAGYSINRVTLFALILALGLVVDDPIVDVENIFRHFAMRKEPPMRAVLTAVNEVRPPIIVATLVVIVSFLPMFFITGMMGPYMRPMALNVPVAMLMSMVVAFTVTPWLSYHVLKSQYGKEAEPFELTRSLTYRIYRAILGPLLRWRALGLAVDRGDGRASGAGLAAAAGRAGAAEDAAVRQQERVSDRRRHAGRHNAGGDPGDATRIGRLSANRARSDRDSDFFGHFLADGLQRPGAALLSPPGPARRRHSRQSCA